VRFRTTLLLAGKTATGIRIPADVMTALGTSRKPAIRVTINGRHTYRSTVATVDGLPTVGVSAENRDAAGIAPGEEIDVDVELDTAPREVTVPEDFGQALAADPAARQTWDGLSYSNRSWHVGSILSAKSPDTRQRRIERSIAALREGKPR
jgi:Bacteriocin-protection, YdeI or OmpD-Associated/Domain of unknown function (DUF1905)